MKWLHLTASDFNDASLQQGAILNPDLITFCDASRKAFGACTYVRWKLTDGKFGVRFVAAKSRVSPLKELTIPRLELQAAVLASRLAKSIQEETRLKILRTMFVSDSRVTLAWIQGMPRSYKPFVSCRVSEIQSNSNPAAGLQITVGHRTMSD